MRWETLPALEELRVVPASPYSTGHHAVNAAPVMRACAALRSLTGVPFALGGVPDGALGRLADVAIAADEVWRVPMLTGLRRLELHVRPQATGGGAWQRADDAPPQDEAAGARRDGRKTEDHAPPYHEKYRSCSQGCKINETGQRWPGGCRWVKEERTHDENSLCSIRSRTIC